MSIVRLLLSKDSDDWRVYQYILTKHNCACGAPLIADLMIAEPKFAGAWPRLLETVVLHTSRRLASGPTCRDLNYVENFSGLIKSIF